MGFQLFLPETFILCVGVLLLCLTLVKTEYSAKTLNQLMVLIAAGLFLICLYSVPSSGLSFSSTYKVDALSQGFKTLLALAFLMVTILSDESISIGKSWRIEYYFFTSTALLGMMIETEDP